MNEGFHHIFGYSSVVAAIVGNGNRVPPTVSRQSCPANRVPHVFPFPVCFLLQWSLTALVAAIRMFEAATCLMYDVWCMVDTAEREMKPQSVSISRT